MPKAVEHQVSRSHRTGWKWESKLAACEDFSKQQRAALRGRLLALEEAKANAFFEGDDDRVRTALKTLLPESAGDHLLLV